MLSQDSNSLLDYAKSKLIPEVFAHAVWLRFSKNEALHSVSVIDDLFCAARSLQTSDPGTACQILLLAAVCQNWVNQHHNALQTTHQVMDLAAAANLEKEMIWARWGACAISLQQGNYEEALRFLADLQAAFDQSREWILANLMEVLRQSLLQPISVPITKNWQSPRTQPFGDAIAMIVESLYHWGLPSQLSETRSETVPISSNNQIAAHFTRIQSFFSIQFWQGRWRTLMLAFRGELRFQWSKHNAPATRGGFSLWESIAGSLHESSSRRQDAMEMNEVPAPIRPVLLPPTEAIVIPPKTSDGEKALSLIFEHREDKSSEQSTTLIPVIVHMLGAFTITINDLTLKLSSSRGVLLLKYLILHHKQNIPREVLMDLFWPDAEPETARNNLNVALHSLRRTVQAQTAISLIVFEDGGYSLASNLKIWIDVEEFERCVQAGQRLEGRNQTKAAIAEYEGAVSLYQGDFLEQNPYEEWTVLDRERLRIAYLDTLDRLSQIYFQEASYSACRSACQLILARDPCREDAHCLLMRCYSRQRQPHLALYQYQICVEALRGELQVEPAPETTQLYNRIRRREQV
jgi:DNA-binding SARP family transcriptional activator